MTSVLCKICDSPSRLLFDDLFDDRHGYRGRFQILRCGNCGFGQTHPEIPEDEIPELYTKYYPRKNISIEDLKGRPVNTTTSLSRWWQGVNNTAHYHVKDHSRVLDIGCGDCTSLRELEHIGCEAFGIEPDGNVRTIAQTFGLNVHFGAFHEMPFPNEYFDYVTMSQVLEHIHRPIDFLLKIARVLKKNGTFIFGVPNVDSRLSSRYGRQWLNWHVPYHLNHFSKRSIRTLAEAAGYRVHRIRTYTPNLWDDLQRQLVAYPVKEGELVPFFNGLPGPMPDRSLSSIKRRLAFTRIPYLRLMDYFGFGESFLAVLTKKT